MADDKKRTVGSVENPVNEIEVFCADGSTVDYDLMPYDEYKLAAPLGNRQGEAQRRLVNTGMRQASLIASALAQAIAENYQPGVSAISTREDIVNGITALIMAHIPEAAVGVKGIAELATTEDVALGTDNTKIVTPLSLRGYAGGGGGGGTANVTAGTSAQGFFYTITEAADGTEILNMSVCKESVNGNEEIIFPDSVFPETLAATVLIDYDWGEGSSFMCYLSDVTRDGLKFNSSPLKQGTNRRYRGLIMAKIDRRDIPQPPANVKSSSEGQVVTIQWSNVGSTMPDTTKVYRSTDVGGVFDVVGGTIAYPTTTATLTDQAPGVWYYKLESTSAGLSSGFSGTTQCVVVATAGAVSIALNRGYVTVSWALPQYASTVVVEKSDNASNWSIWYQGTNTSQDLSGQQAICYFRLKGIAQNAVGAYGAIFTFTPTMPSPAPVLSVAQDDAGNPRLANLSWSASSNAVGYEVYVNDGLVHYLTGLSYQYKAEAAANFRVRAIGGAMYSDSNVVAYTPQVPQAPTGLAATQGSADKNQCTLTWAAAGGVTGYNIYRWTGSAEEYIGETAATSYTLTQTTSTTFRVYGKRGSWQSAAFASVGYAPVFQTVYFDGSVNYEDVNGSTKYMSPNITSQYPNMTIKINCTYSNLVIENFGMGNKNVIIAIRCTLAAPAIGYKYIPITDPFEVTEAGGGINIPVSWFRTSYTLNYTPFSTALQTFVLIDNDTNDPVQNVELTSGAFTIKIES